MRNALLRLGWSHGDDEIIDTAQAIAWFDLDAVNRGAARFDMEKLQSLNGHYIRESADAGPAGRYRAPGSPRRTRWPPRTRGAGASQPCCPKPRRARRRWSSSPITSRSCSAIRNSK